MKSTTLLFISIFLSVIVFSSEILSQGISPNYTSTHDEKPPLPRKNKNIDKKEFEDSFHSIGSQNWKPYQLWEHGSSLHEPIYLNDSIVVTAGLYSASLINLRSKQLIRNFTTFTWVINSVDLTKDKKRILTCSRFAINIFDVESGEIRNIISPLLTDSAFTHAKFSPDGHNIVVSNTNGEVIIYNSFTRQLVNRVKLHNDVINWVTYNYDGSKIASAGNDNSVVIYDANSLKFHSSLSTFTGAVTAVCFNKQGNLIAAGGVEGKVIIHNIENSISQPPISIINDQVNSINFSEDDNNLLVAGFGGPISIVSLETQEIQRLSLGRYSFFAGRLNSNSTRLLLTSNDGVLRESNSNFDGINGIRIPVTSIGVGPINFSQNDTFLFTGSDWLTRTININTGNFLTSFVTQNAPIFAFDVTQTGEIHFTGGGGGSLIIRRAFEEAIELNAHQTSVWAVDITPNGSKALSGDANGNVVVWDMSSAAEKYRFSIPQSGIYDVKISPNEQYFAVASQDNFVRIYNFETGDQLFEYNTLESPWKIQWNENNSMIYAVNFDGMFFKIDLQAKQGQSFFHHDYSVFNFTLDPTETKMFFTDFNEIYSFNLTTNTIESQVQFLNINGDVYDIREPQFNKNNSKIAFYSDYFNLHLVSLEKWITSVSATPMFQAQAFPNPAQYKVDVVFNKALVNPTYSMYNADGSSVDFSIISQSVDKVSFNVANLPNGVYYVQAIEGNTQIRSKFVISK